MLVGVGLPPSPRQIFKNLDLIKMDFGIPLPAPQVPQRPLGGETANL